MRLLTVFLFTASIAVSARPAAQTITYSGKGISLTEIFSVIKKQTGFLVIGNKSIFNNDKKLSLSVKNLTLREFLDKVLQDQPVEYEIEGKTVFLSSKPTLPINSLPVLPPGQVHLAFRTIRGIVSDEQGNRLEGATVTLKNKSISTTTNYKGEFELSANDGDILLLSYVGFQNKEVKVFAVELVIIKMVKIEAAMDTIVTIVNTGYQRLPKERATGSFDVVKQKDIENKIQPNILERLEGMVPGLLIINGKDNGSSDAITIRGVSTLSGTKRPLIVVDNFPISGDINTINPNDVETITLLKDAAAASIWGAQAANGVIVITTKRAGKGVMKFTYNNSFQLQAKPDLDYLNRLFGAEDIAFDKRIVTPDLLDGAMNWGTPFSKMEGLYLDSLQNVITTEEYNQKLDSLGRLDNTKQIKDLLMQQPFTMTHSIAMNGGSENMRFYGSVRHVKSNGFALKDQSRNLNMLFKGDFNITPSLFFSLNSNFSVQNGTSAPVNPLEVFRYKPYEMLQDASGNPLAFNTSGDPYNQNPSNPYSIQKRIAWGLGDESYYPLKELNRRFISNRSSTQRIQSELRYKLTEGLNVSLYYQVENGAGFNQNITSSDQWELVKLINDLAVPQYDNFGDIITNPDGTLRSPTFNIPLGGKLVEGRSDFSSNNIRATIVYNKDISDHQQVALLAGGERRSIKTSFTQVAKFGYEDKTLQFIPIDAQLLANGVPGQLSPFETYYYEQDDNFFNFTENRFIAAFANGAYTYKRKYIVSGSARMDATNLFGTDPKYMYRPNWSGGLSWIVSKEDFFRTSFVNLLQLRATYGINGNIPKSSGPFMIAMAGVNPLSNLRSNIITTPANDQLRWERTFVTNLGLDYALLNHRIFGKVDIYARKSKDLLANDNVNPTSGFTTAIVNAASMINRGVEIELTTKNIEVRNFKWSTTMVYAYNNNKVTKVTATVNQNNAYYRAAVAGNLEGYPYQSIFSYRFAGLSDNGQLQVYNAKGDIDDNSSLITDINALTFSGNTRPVSSGSLGNFLSYKNFELSFMFMFYGNHYKRSSVPDAAVGVDAMDGQLVNAWKVSGDEQRTNIPDVIKDYSNFYYSSVYYRSSLDAFVFNASYIKLREVILTYTLSDKKLANKKYIKGLQINLQGRNLWRHAKNNMGIDPEAFAGGVRIMPVMPTYALGLNLNF